MFSFSKRQTGSAPISLAATARAGVAVQLARAAVGALPVLRLAQLQTAGASIAGRLDAVARRVNLRRAPVRVLLDRSEYQILQIEAPAVPDEEMRNAVRWQVKDMLRTPIDEVTLDVATPPGDLPAGRRALAFVVAAANTIVRERMLGFRVFRSEVEVIDIPEMAQRNIADRLEEAGRATAVLWVGEQGALLTASKAGVLYFTRYFELPGGFAADRAVRSEQLDRLVLELQRSVDVLEHQFSFLSVSTLWLAPFAHADELLSLLIEQLYLPARMIDFKRIVDCSQCALPESPVDQAAFFHPLGLALRGMGGVA